MVTKFFNFCISLYDYIITMCIKNAIILKTQVVPKSGDIEINSGPKNDFPTSFVFGT